MNTEEQEILTLKLNELEDCLDNLQKKYSIDGMDKLDFIDIIDDIKDSLF